MPNYYYEAVTDGGKRAAGALRAAGKQAAIHELRAKGYTVRSVREKHASFWSRELALGKAVKPEDFAVFCRQLATLVRAGIRIDRALDIMVEQTKAKKLKESAAAVQEQVRSGVALSAAMGGYPRVFPEMFVNMVASGEAGGLLDDVLERMADSYEKENETIKKVKSAMTYPIMLLVIAAGVVIFLLTRIVPTFVGLFDEQGAQLPWITRSIMDASAAVMRGWWIAPLAFAGLALVGRAVLRNERGKYEADRLKFCVPVFGTVLKKAAIARMSRTLASLYVSGVGLLQALEITGRAVGNRVLAGALRQARASLQQGRQLSASLAESRLFPDMVVQMIAVGEETGQLDNMLDKVADFFESDVNAGVDRLKAVVEPAMLLLISVIVGFIVAAVITPMFAMYKSYLN